MARSTKNLTAASISRLVAGATVKNTAGRQGVIENVRTDAAGTLMALIKWDGETAKGKQARTVVNLVNLSVVQDAPAEVLTPLGEELAAIMEVETVAELEAACAAYAALEEPESVGQTPEVIIAEAELAAHVATAADLELRITECQIIIQGEQRRIADLKRDLKATNAAIKAAVVGKRPTPARAA